MDTPFETNLSIELKELAIKLEWAIFHVHHEQYPQLNIMNGTNFACRVIIFPIISQESNTQMSKPNE